MAAMEEAVLDGEPALASRTAESPAARKLLRGEIDAVLTKALRREPESRYATADAMADDIDRHLHGERVLARGNSIACRAGKALRRNRLELAAGAAVLLAFLAGASAAVMWVPVGTLRTRQQASVAQSWPTSFATGIVAVQALAVAVAAAQFAP